MMETESSRSHCWITDPRPRHWWHRLPGMDYVPPIYSDLTDQHPTVASAARSRNGAPPTPTLLAAETQWEDLPQYDNESNKWHDSVLTARKPG